MLGARQTMTKQIEDQEGVIYEKSDEELLTIQSENQRLMNYQCKALEELVKAVDEKSEEDTEENDQ